MHPHKPRGAAPRADTRAFCFRSRMNDEIVTIARAGRKKFIAASSSFPRFPRQRSAAAAAAPPPSARPLH